MEPFSGADPGQFLIDFCGGFKRAVTETEEDLGAIVDRFHTPDMAQTADGHRMNRARLIAHLRPLRKRKPRSRLRVHEATTEGDLLAARYTMHVESGRRSFSIDVHYFGRFTPDGRLREAHLLTRLEKPAEDAEISGTPASPMTPATPATAPPAPTAWRCRRDRTDLHRGRHGLRALRGFRDRGAAARRGGHRGRRGRGAGPGDRDQ